MASDATLRDLPPDSSASSDSPSGPSTLAGTIAPKTRRDAALDGLRGLAILLVFIFHYGGGLQSTQPAQRLAGYFTQFSWSGVVLFFALSGFLITGSLWETNHTVHRLRNFYVRRALRILPLYIVALLAVAIAALLTGAHFTQLRPLLVFVFFLQNFPHLSSYALSTPSPLPLYHFWTLAVEEQFYLIWPIVLFLAHSRRHALRLSLWFFGICAFFLFSIYTMAPFVGAVTHHLYDYFLLTQGGAIALGCALSLAMGNRASPIGRKPGTHRLIRKYAQPAFFIGLAIYLLAGIACGTFYITYPVQFWLGLPALSIAAAAAIPLVLRTGLPRKIFSWGPLGWLGRISYGFYVFHILLEPLYDRLGANISHTNAGDYYHIVRAIVAFLLTCVISWLSFNLFEMPILSLKRFFPVNASLPWGEPIADTHRARHKSSRSKGAHANE
ncbi:MAG TPA: acyltransferase [Acidobacteriaceae bacterium]|nr:acyltransferase [Acidobacteriaceae bacterium]